MHSILILLGCIILLFSNNIYYICLVLNVVFIDGIAMLSYHECPLTILEQKYLDTNMSKQVKETLNNLDILHNCNHIYETQFELIINIVSLLIIKMFALIIMKSFSISLS
jgi:hypothetical protein